MKELWQSIDKFRLANSTIIGSIFLSILFMFAVQFKIEALQDEIIKTESEIASYEDEIQLLEVEWVYLTRPERLRTLASLYLKDNGYALASQIKDTNQLEQFYFANYQKIESKQVASNEDESGSRQVSF